MADYRIVADVTAELVRLTREALCPLLLPHPEQIAAGAPDSRDNEALLNIYLYGLGEDTDYQPERRIGVSGQMVDWPYVLALRYVLFFARHAQSPLDPFAEQQCMGRLCEVFCRMPPLEPARFHTAADTGDEPAAVRIARLDDSQKRELWTGFSEPLRPALYLEITPLLLGGRSGGAQRVRDLEGRLSRK